MANAGKHVTDGKRKKTCIVKKRGKNVTATSDKRGETCNRLEVRDRNSCHDLFDLILVGPEHYFFIEVGISDDFVSFFFNSTLPVS